MTDRTTAMMAAGVFAVCFCGTLVVERLSQGQGEGKAAIKPPTKAQVHDALPLSGPKPTKDEGVAGDRTDIVWSIGLGSGQGAGDEAPGPVKTQIATFDTDHDTHVLCRADGVPGQMAYGIIEYDAVRWAEREATDAQWRASGCAAAADQASHLMDDAQATRMQVATIPDTPKYRRLKLVRRAFAANLPHAATPWTRQSGDY